MQSEFPAAHGGAAPESNHLAMTSVTDFAARRVCATPRASSPAGMQVAEPRLPAAGRSGTSGQDKSRLDLFRASLKDYKVVSGFVVNQYIDK